MADRILVVDDDAHIRDVICFALDKAGYATIQAGDGAAALAAFESEAPVLIVLDVGLPELDGLEVCRRVRRAGETPILFVSARDEEIDRVLGLELGGDDYLTKPFSPRELVARVNAILKRSKPRATEEAVVRVGGLALDRPRFHAEYNGAPLTLTALEFTILYGFALKPGFVFDRAQIMAAAYDDVHVSDRTIDSHIRNIRAKFAALGCADIIETVHGVGFRLGALKGS